MPSDLRMRLGGRLLTERVQVKDWNVAQAAKAAKVDPKVINRIEHGENYEWDSLEKYAVALGHDLDWWLRDLIREGRPEKAAAPPREPFRAHDKQRRRRPPR